VNANHMRRNQVAGLELLQRIGPAGMRALVQDDVWILARLNQLKSYLGS
jgi:hypothetical protein